MSSIALVDFWQNALSARSEPAWMLTENGYEPALEHEVESRFAVGNGFLGVRGSLEQPTLASRPRTYIAGLFAFPETNPPVPSLVSAPEWLRLRLFVDGEEISLEKGEILEHNRSLDFQRGVLHSSLRQKAGSGVSVHLEAMRFAALSTRGVAAQIASIEVDQPSTLKLEVGLGPGSPALEIVQHSPSISVFRVRRRPVLLAIASQSSLRLNGRRLATAVEQSGSIMWAWDAIPGDTVQLRRMIGFARGEAEEEARDRAQKMVSAAPSAYRRLYTNHVAAWKRRWSSSDISIEGDDASQNRLRFAIYHLISAANPEDAHVSIGARALTGDAYKGHVFWDTEIFLLPFYTFTWPEAARAMLMYRFHTLPAALAKAKRLGYRGALYAWESADSGEETTPPFALGPQQQVIPVLSGAQEHHISADIAYAVWQYWRATGDNRFMLKAGAEILLETSRFWVSRVELESDGRYHIRGVIGPDEYHEGVDDNAYTNVMAAFNIELGLEVVKLLQRRWPTRWAALGKKLSLSAEETSLWGEVREKLLTGFDPGTGLFEQFAGFFRLEDIDLKAYAERTAPMDVILGSERTRRSQVVKQADVIMLLALLGERYDHLVREANFRYYEARTGHGSSLSPAAHAVVAARLGDVSLAKKFFDETAAIDLDDTMGNAAGGVHIGALGGLWQTATFGFAGLQLKNSGLRFEPHLPEGWRRLSFSIRWRRRTVKVEISGEPHEVIVSLESGAPMSIYAGSLEHRLRRDETWRCARNLQGEWQEALT